MLHLYRRLPAEDGEPRFALIGYVTVYLYYAYPEHVRPRIRCDARNDTLGILETKFSQAQLYKPSGGFLPIAVRKGV